MSLYPENDYGQQHPRAPQPLPVPQLPPAPQMGFVPQFPPAPQPFAVPQMNYVPQPAPARQVSFAPQPAAAPVINIVNTPGAQVSTGVKKSSCKRTFAMVIISLRIVFIFILLVCLLASAEKLNAKGYNSGAYIFLSIAALLFETFGFIGACSNSHCMMVSYTVALTLIDLLSLGIIIDFPWIIFCICFCVSMRKQ